MKRNNKGITLIVVVISVVVLLILAGISMFFAFGDNSIINRSKEVARKQELSEIEEKQKLQDYENNIDSKKKNKLYIKSRVTQDRNYDCALITVECRIGGIPKYKTYVEYVNPQQYLDGKTEQEKIDLIAITEYNNYKSYYDNNYPGQEVTLELVLQDYNVTTVEELLEKMGCETVDDLLIYWKAFKKQEYTDYQTEYNTKYRKSIQLTKPDGTTVTTTNMSSTTYVVTDNGEYKFIASYEDQIVERIVQVVLVKKEKEIEMEKINEDEYKMSCIEDLVKLSLNVKNGYSYLNKTFQLTRTLDFNDVNSYKNASDTKTFGDYNGDGIVENIKSELTNVNGTGFMPIGLYNYSEFIEKTVDRRFKGTFNGNNFEIKNLYINNEMSTVGLFGINQGFVCNLKIDGNFSLNGSANRYVGGCVAYNFGIIENVTCNVNVSDTNAEKSYSYIGGVCAYNSVGKIIDCTNLASINLEKSKGYVAGITAYSTAGSKITRCKNLAENITVKNATYVAGVCGFFNEGRMNECYNIADFNCESCTSLGGVIAANNSINAVFNRCYNTGDMECNDVDYVGGVIAYAPNSILMMNVFNTGNINVILGDYNDIGGVIGYHKYGLIANAYNTGDVSYVGESVRYVGGVVGDGTIGCRNANVYNIGNIHVEAPKCTVGGVNAITYHTSVMLNDYNFGNIETIGVTESLVGGLAGASWGTITNCKYLEGTWTTGIGNRSDGAGTCETCTMDIIDEMLDSLNEEKRTVGDYTIPADMEYDKWEIREGVNNGFPVFTWQ